MTFADDLPVFYADFGETVVLNGSPITAIFDGGFVDAGGLGVAGTAPTVRCLASVAAAAVFGSTLVRGGITYLVRNKEPIAPDELEVRLFLESQA